MKALLRLMTIVAALLASWLVGSLVALLGAGILELQFGIESFPALDVIVEVFAVILSHMLVLGALPVLLVIIAAERHKHTTPRFYVLCGTAIGTFCFLAFLLFWIHAQGPGPETFLWRMQNRPHELNAALKLIMFVPAGAVSGMIYWWIAGRNAGRWRGERVQVQ